MYQALPRLLLLGLFGVSSFVAAQDAPGPGAAPATDAEEQPALTPEQKRGLAAWEAAMAAMVRGPATVTLRDQASLAVPDGFGFVPLKAAQPLMRLMGNETDEGFMGLVYPLAEDAGYFMSLDYVDAGYIKDDEARDWDAAELLQNLKDGTEAANEDREKVGISPIKVTRWIEPPAYDARNHRLVWSAEAVLKDGVDADPTINYNTYVLGREGYISANLITVASTVDADRQQAGPVLQAVTFNETKRYTDFDSSSDKVAAYGLTALVGGLAAKKLGVLAIMTGLAVKFAKIIAVSAVALVAGARKFFGRKSDSPV